MFMLKALCEDPDEQAALRRAEQIMAIARAFFSDAGLVCARLPEYIYGEHLKLFGGRVGDDHPGLPAPPAPQESFILDPEYLEGLKAGGARDG